MGFTPHECLQQFQCDCVQACNGSMCAAVRCSIHHPLAQSLHCCATHWQWGVILECAAADSRHTTHTHFAAPWFPNTYFCIHPLLASIPAAQRLLLSCLQCKPCTTACWGGGLCSTLGTHSRPQTKDHSNSSSSVKPIVCWGTCPLSMSCGKCRCTTAKQALSKGVTCFARGRGPVLPMLSLTPALLPPSSVRMVRGCRGQHYGNCCW